ncbi:MAG: 30S ribosomal protein S6 [Anaerolineae bacterium]
MRNYELGLVLQPTLDETEITRLIEKIRQYLSTDGGNVMSVDIWGKRPLAYPIRKQREGIYVFLQAQIDPRKVEQLERNLKLDENILRHLLIHAET